MSICKILVPMDGSERDALALTLAFSAAQTFNAHVEAMHVRLTPANALPFVGEGMSASLVQELVELTERESAARATAARTTFDEMRAAAGFPTGRGGREPGSDGGFSASWLEIQGQEDDAVVRAGRLADLIVITRPAPAGGGGSRSAFSAALFETGRPVLVSGTQPAPLRLERVVVAWDGSAQAARALASALPILTRSAQVTVVTSQEARGNDQELEEVTAYLACHGIRAGHRVVMQYPSVAESLLAAAVGSDILVMGGYSHSRLREMILGGVTRYMLERAALPLFLAH